MSGSKGVDDVGNPYRRPVILSAAKDLASLPKRSFAALRMTGRTPLKSAHGKHYLQMSMKAPSLLTIFVDNLSQRY